MAAGNVETGVVFAVNEGLDDKATGCRLFWHHAAKPVGAGDFAVGEVGDAPDAEPILEAPPILSAMIERAPSWRLRLLWRDDAPAEYRVSVSWTGRDWRDAKRGDDLALADDDSSAALHVRGGSGREWIVPVVDRQGRVGWQPRRFDTYADALASLLDFPIRPAEATDDDDHGRGDGHATNGDGTGEVVEQKKNYALHAAAEFLEKVAALQTALPESMLDDWLDHLDRTLRAAFPPALIVTWKTHRLDVFAHLQKCELRSRHLTLTQKERYFEVLDGAARAWGLR